jgi:hypothetical protein
MSKRSRAVAKQIAAQPMPFHYHEWLDKCDARLGPHVVHELLAPVLVRTDARSAVYLSMMHSNWRNAIKPAILEYMKEFNLKFADAQQAQWELSCIGSVSPHSAILSILATPGNQLTQHQLETRPEQDRNDPATAAVNAKLNEMQEALRDRRDKVETWRACASTFNSMVVGHVLKMAGVATGPNEDPRQFELHRPITSNPVKPRERQIKPYIVGEQSVHAYAAMACRNCEVCGPLGLKCQRSTTGFTTAPYAQGCEREQMRLLYTGMECIAKQCFRWNTMAMHPLQVPQHHPPMRRGMQSELVCYSAVNNDLLEAALRHMNVPTPVQCTSLQSRLRDADHALITKDGMHMPPVDLAGVPANPFVQEGHISERMGRFFWLFHHPTLPQNYSFEHKLRMTPRCIQLARDDIKRADERDRAIEKATRQINWKKLRGDLEALLADRSGLKAQDMTTIEALDAHFPGTAATAHRILDSYNTGKTAHALDVQFTRNLVNTAEMMAVDMRRWDQSFCEEGRVASGRAYTWITGMSCGEVPGISLSDIANKLNDDPRALQYDVKDWNAYVTTAHVFDALQWNNLTLTKKTKLEAGCSSEPLGSREEEGACFWHIGIGVGDTELLLKGEVTFPTSRQEWHVIRNHAEALLDKNELDAALPPVPSQGQIDDLLDPNAEAKTAMEWIENIAQTLAYWPVTRALGLDTLTNYSTRGVVNAVGNSLVDLQMLDIAKTLKLYDGAPME